MPEGFPLPISSYRELTRIIGAYGKVPENSVPADVGRLIGINETIVSANNGFLKAVGIILGGKKKTTTSAGSALASAYEYDRQDEIASTWRRNLTVNETGEPRGVVVGGSEAQTDAQTVGPQQRTACCFAGGSVWSRIPAA